MLRARFHSRCEEAELILRLIGVLEWARLAWRMRSHRPREFGRNEIVLEAIG
jgi:hypothetical protein